VLWLHTFTSTEHLLDYTSYITLDDLITPKQLGLPAGPPPPLSLSIMAEAYTPDDWHNITPIRLKGFIELVLAERRLLIAISNIVGVSEGAPKGCTLTIVQNVVGAGTESKVLYLRNSYDEVVQLLKTAQ
jgi:hypothetical protein